MKIFLYNKIVSGIKRIHVLFKNSHLLLEEEPKCSNQNFYSSKKEKKIHIQYSFCFVIYDVLSQ